MSESMAKQSRLAKAASRIFGQPMFKLLERAHELERQGRSILHFEIGDPDFATPPAVVDAAVEALRAGKTHYVSSFGIPELREAICEATHRDLGFRPSPAQVVILPANAVIYFALRCVVNPGDEVLVPDPGFSTYDSAIRFMGAKAVPVPLREAHGFRMQPDDVKRRLTKRARLIIVNSPHNPTGAVMRPDDVLPIAALAARHGAYLLSDEVYRKVWYDPGTPPSASTRDQCREHTILLNSFSKSHAMAGWRLGYAIAPEPVAHKMGMLVQTILSCLPPFIQHAGVAALQPDSDQAVRNMVEQLRRRREVMIDGLNRLPGVTCVLPGGAFYAFPNIEGTGRADRAFAEEMLEQAGVALLPGSDFGAAGKGHVRLCYTTSIDNITEGLSRMRAVLQGRRVSTKRRRSSAELIASA